VSGKTVNKIEDELSNYYLKVVKNKTQNLVKDITYLYTQSFSM